MFAAVDTVVIQNPGWTPEQWVFIIVAVIGALGGLATSIIGALRSGRAEITSKANAIATEEIRQSVDGKMETIVESAKTIAKAEGRAEGVSAGQAGEVPPLPAVHAVVIGVTEKPDEEAKP